MTRFATRGDHRLSYESNGGADGIPVLALHDLLADRGQLRGLAVVPGGGGLRLTLPDARGHGASPMISGGAYATGELVADALAVLDAEGLKETHVAAVGWGAVTALGLVAAAPERVASLALAAPFVPGLFADPAMPRAHHPHLETLQEAASAAEKGQTDRALDLYLGLRLGEGWRERLPKPRLGAIRRASGNLGPLLAGLIAGTLDQEAFARMRLPATIVTSEQAPALERDIAGRLASLLPRATIERIQIEENDHSPQGSGWLPTLARALARQRT